MTATKTALRKAALANGWTVVADTRKRLSFERADDFIAVNFNEAERATYADAFRGDGAWKVFGDSFDKSYITHVNVKDRVLAALAMPGQEAQDKEAKGEEAASVTPLMSRVDFEGGEGMMGFTLWHKNVKGDYDTNIDLSPDAEEHLLEILLARRNARLTALRGA